MTSGRGKSAAAIDGKIKRYIRTGYYEIPDTENKNHQESVAASLMGVAGYEKFRKA